MRNRVSRLRNTHRVGALECCKGERTTQQERNRNNSSTRTCNAHVETHEPTQRSCTWRRESSGRSQSIQYKSEQVLDAKDQQQRALDEQHSKREQNGWNMFEPVIMTVRASAARVQQPRLGAFEPAFEPVPVAADQHAAKTAPTFARDQAQGLIHPFRL